MPYARKYRRTGYKVRSGRRRFVRRRGRRSYGKKRYGGHSQRRKNLRSCGQDAALSDNEASPSNDPTTGSATLFTGNTLPLNTIAVSWNIVLTGNERFNKSGDYIWRTGFWMKLRMTHAAAETNPRNDQMRIMLTRDKAASSPIEAQYPFFDRPVGKELLERCDVLYDRIIKVGNKGFNTTGIDVVRDFWIKLKLFDKLDFHGAGQGDVDALVVPHSNALKLYAVLPEARTAVDSVLITILDWKMYYYNSNA